MNTGVLWSLWFGTLATLPLVLTRLLIKHGLERVVVRRRSSFVRQREK